MSDFSLSIEAKKELEYAMKKTSRVQADRIRAILALNKGYSFAVVADILRLDDSTIRRYFECYKAEGLTGLLADNYLGRSCQLTESQQKSLIEHLQQNIYQEAKAIVAYIKITFNVQYTISGLIDLLHRLGFSYKKPKTLPGKADVQKQKDFVAEYQAIKESKAAEDQIYFIDGVHPVHNVQPAYGWLFKGKETVLKTNTGRERINLNGAYNIENQKLIIRSDDSINAQSSIQLLEMIKIQQPTGKIHIISDNAKYYKCNILTEYLKNEENQRITFHHLPPYSPNLNCIERLWKFMKKKTTYNIYYEKFKDFKASIVSFFEQIEKYNNELKSLITDKFHIVQFRNS